MVLPEKDLYQLGSLSWHTPLSACRKENSYRFHFLFFCVTPSDAQGFLLVCTQKLLLAVHRGHNVGWWGLNSG